MNPTNDRGTYYLDRDIERLGLTIEARLARDAATIKSLSDCLEDCRALVESHLDEDGYEVSDLLQRIDKALAQAGVPSSVTGQ